MTTLSAIAPPDRLRRISRFQQGISGQIAERCPARAVWHLLLWGRTSRGKAPPGTFRAPPIMGSRTLPNDRGGLEPKVQPRFGAGNVEDFTAGGHQRVAAEGELYGPVRTEGDLLKDSPRGDVE